MFQIFCPFALFFRPVSLILEDGRMKLDASACFLRFLVSLLDGFEFVAFVEFDTFGIPLQKMDLRC
jgi:hypothetical protein